MTEDFIQIHFGLHYYMKYIINKDYGISFEKETGEQEKAQEWRLS